MIHTLLIDAVAWKFYSSSRSSPLNAVYDLSTAYRFCVTALGPPLICLFNLLQQAITFIKYGTVAQYRLEYVYKQIKNMITSKERTKLASISRLKFEMHSYKIENFQSS
jgi:hypothetical protein